jgi:voltage-gated potassium channel
VERRTGVRDSRLQALALTLAAFVLLVGLGTAAYALLLDEPLVSAFYRAINAVSTTGEGRFPRTRSGELVTVTLILAGVTIVFIAVGLLIELVVGGVISGAWERRRMGQRIDRMEGHHIVCGYGRVGRRVVAELQAAGRDAVVIDANPEAARRAAESGVAFIAGDGSDDEVLAAAGIERAQGLVACADDDAANTFVALTAKGIRPELEVIGRASTESAAVKLRRAGADRAVSPYETAGRQLAALVMRPQVEAYLTLAASGAEPSFGLEEIVIPDGWPLGGRTIGELEIRSRTGALVLAVRARGEPLRGHPTPDTPLRPGDVVIGVGLPEQIAALEELLVSGR